MYSLTATVEEGPFYKEGSPKRRNIADQGVPGRQLLLEGQVLDCNGKPIPGAWLDFWHTDGNGVYDNEGYKLRGHQYTDENGRYRLETIRPQKYQARAAHIHVKVQAAERAPILTTQLFFPDEDRNQSDPLFEPRTVIKLTHTQEGLHATFDFVVQLR